ncbi:MAG: tRNA glutamyl-Q(34) synthetase GluQRS [Phycisphaerales bacterium]|nr:tRNA glutamyl-Q(34) synthetase GluQRS [Phycisphaerales bacterium]
MSNPTDRVNITRLAPSPTGALHLGNARTFLVNWAMARREGWRIILRIDDLDGPRVKPWAADQAVEDLRWLGMDWDEGPIRQTDDAAPYRQAMAELAGSGEVFPCSLSRTQIEEAMSAPHTRELRFSPSLRPVGATPRFGTDDEMNWRLKTSDEMIRFDDACAGPVKTNPWAEVGDFVVWTKRNAPAYQLAVVVDDARQGVTQVVRGDDLLSSTGRQILLYRALALGPIPTYTHLPLVVGPDGRRLAKRHGDTRISTYRQLGVPAERIVGLLAWWCGVCDEPMEMTGTQFADRLRHSPRALDRVTMRPEDDRWLRSG